MEKNKKLYFNADIFTSDLDNLHCRAMRVEDGKVTWVGNSYDIDELQKEGFKTIDLKGKKIIPGFIDAHMHGVMLANVCKQISCLPPEINSIEELIDKIAEVRKTQEKGKWIKGWGYDEGKLKENRAPNRWDLDKACEDSPVFMGRTCAHIASVNSKALELAGITKDTVDPPGGEIERDENGEPTGILKETAKDMMSKVMPEVTSDMVVDNLLDLGQLLAKAGITAITDLGNFSPIDNYPDYIQAIEKGFKQKVSIYYMWDYFSTQKNFKITDEMMNNKKQLHASGIKLVGDGSVSGRTAFLNEPYLGTDDDYGISVCSDELIDDAISESKKYGCQLSVHAMGGRTIDRIINRVYGEKKWTVGDIPHVRVEHITEPSADAISKAAEKGIYFVTQPIFLYSEIESYIMNLGEERLKKTYPNRTMLDKGVHLVFSSDSPATAWSIPYDPFTCIKGAVTRVAYDGTDCGQEQKVTMEEAIIMYTAEAAKAAGFYKTGMIKEGYCADFLIMDKNDFSMNGVVNTFIDGELVFER